MGNKKTLWLFVVVYFIIALAACTGNADPLPNLDAGEVRTLGDQCVTLYGQHINAWNSKEPENFRQIYTDDIVHFDGEPLFVGIDEVIDMADFMYEVFPDWEMEAGETYISKEKCLGIWINWGVFGFTQEDPGREYDLLETRGDKIFYWTLYYDQKFNTAVESQSGYDFIEPDFLTKFATTWSSGKSGDVAKMYTEDAMLEDSLFDVSITSQKEVSQYAKSFFAKSPDANWKVLYTFAESQATFPYVQEHPIPGIGGVFGVTSDSSSCEIRVVVIFKPDAEGSIQSQEVFYNTDTLLACGWAE